VLQREGASVARGRGSSARVDLRLPDEGREIVEAMEVRLAAAERLRGEVATIVAPTVDRVRVDAIETRWQPGDGKLCSPAPARPLDPRLEGQGVTTS